METTGVIHFDAPDYKEKKIFYQNCDSEPPQMNRCITIEKTFDLAKKKLIGISISATDPVKACK